MAAVWVRGKEAEFDSIRWPVGTWKAWWKRVAGLIFIPRADEGLGVLVVKFQQKSDNFRETTTRDVPVRPDSPVEPVAPVRP